MPRPFLDNFSKKLEESKTLGIKNLFLICNTGINLVIRFRKSPRMHHRQKSFNISNIEGKCNKGTQIKIRKVSLRCRGLIIIPTTSTKKSLVNLNPKNHQTTTSNKTRIIMTGYPHYFLNTKINWRMFWKIMRNWKVRWPKPKSSSTNSKNQWNKFGKVYQIAKKSMTFNTISKTRK